MAASAFSICDMSDVGVGGTVIAGEGTGSGLSRIEDRYAKAVNGDGAARSGSGSFGNLAGELGFGVSVEEEASSGASIGLSGRGTRAGWTRVAGSEACGEATKGVVGC